MNLQERIARRLRAMAKARIDRRAPHLAPIASYDELGEFDQETHLEWAAEVIRLMEWSRQECAEYEERERGGPALPDLTLPPDGWQP